MAKRLKPATLAAACALLLILLLAAATAVAAPGPENELTRQRDVVVVAGAALPDFADAPLDDLFLFAFDGTAWQQIPFQWDEVEPISNTYTTVEDGLLDGNDELSFVARDAGLEAPVGTWIDDNASTAFPRYQLQVSDPLHAGESAWAYLFRSPDLSTDFGSPYIQVGEDVVTTPFYSVTANFSDTLGLTGLAVNGVPANIVDGTHISIKGTIFIIIPLQLCEQDLAAFITDTTTITGIIPPTGMPVRYVAGQADGSGAGVYPASIQVLGGALDLDALAAAVPIAGVSLNELRLTLDFLAPGASGFGPATYYNSAIAPGGVPVDGIPDSVPNTLALWSQHSGSSGSVFLLTGVETTAATASQYYLDNASASAADCHGPDGAYGESGVRLAPFSGVVTLTQRLVVAEPLAGPAGDLYLAYAANPLQAAGAIQATCYFADVEPNANHADPGLCDGDVDVADVERVAACWNQAAGSAGCPASLDLDRSGLIDLLDIVEAATQWGWMLGNGER